jgi:hypothetical protein
MSESSPLTPRQRLALFYERLAKQPPCSSAEEALAQLRETLTDIEDAFSGIPRSDPPPPPGQTDGRMYPPLDDFVIREPDGRITARTRSHKIDLGPDGSIRIVHIRTGKSEFEKPGGGT